ncbi:hypothetical protein CJP46_11770 [Paenibacillus sp. XY044]|nr:hypothetical protein CJP46_11770 [Paenibacillus sp. XY044]
MDELRGVHNLHMQLLEVYEKCQSSQHRYQLELEYYYRQLNFFCTDTLQRIFVLNQLINIYEKRRGSQIQWCSDLFKSNDPSKPST